LNAPGGRTLLFAAVSLLACGAHSSTAAPRKVVLRSSLAGRWYPADPAELTREIQGYLEAASPPPAGETVTALILPHAGYRWSGKVAAAGLRRIAGRRFDRVIVLGPSHTLPLRNVASIPRATHYATPLGEVPLDTEFLARLRRYPEFRTIPPVHRREHSVQMEVPLLQSVLHDFRLVPIVVGSLDAATIHRMAAILLGRIDARSLVVASSDFTHYGPRYDYLPFRKDVADNLRKLDMGAFDWIAKRDEKGLLDYIAKTKETICGRYPIAILLAMLGPKSKVRLVRYDTSGAVSGDWSNSVSYLSIAITGGWAEAAPVPAPGSLMPLSKQDRKILLELARKSLVHALTKGERPTPAALGIEIPDRLRRPCAAFVTLYNGEDLRGCLGQIYAGTPLFEVVMEEAVDAATRDRRFTPVQVSELPAIRITVSVMSDPRPVDSADDIVIGKHGIILIKDGSRAVFLPQVAPEMGWTKEETLAHLSRKAGLPADAWKQGARFEVFTAEVIREEKE